MALGLPDVFAFAVSASLDSLSQCAKFVCKFRGRQGNLIFSVMRHKVLNIKKYYYTHRFIENL